LFRWQYVEEEIPPVENIYNRTIRTNNIDYFIWLGDNTTASIVKLNITGFNEGTEYIAVFNDTGVWVKYYDNDTGTDWNINTFDIVQVYLDDSVGNITFNMTANPNINYSHSRTVALTKIGNGYNYTGYTNSTNSNLSNINTSLTLASGFFVGRWNRTIFSWDIWISGFGTMSGLDYTVSRWDVMVTKIDGNKNWAM
jgi:hypothetical protein